MYDSIHIEIVVKRNPLFLLKIKLIKYTELYSIICIAIMNIILLSFCHKRTCTNWKKTVCIHFQKSVSKQIIQLPSFKYNVYG